MADISPFRLHFLWEQSINRTRITFGFWAASPPPSSAILSLFGKSIPLFKMEKAFAPYSRRIKNQEAPRRDLNRRVDACNPLRYPGLVYAPCDTDRPNPPFRRRNSHQTCRLFSLKRSVSAVFPPSETRTIGCKP